MSEKKIRIILMSVVLIIGIVVAVGFFVFSKIQGNKETIDVGEIREIPVESYPSESVEEEFDAAEEDCVQLDDYGYRVYVDNYLDLHDYLIEDGVVALEPYLDQYFDYYDPEGANYEAEVDLTTFESDVNWPQFYITVHMEDRDLEVCCIYWMQTGYYDFFSDLSGDAK